MGDLPGGGRAAEVQPHSASFTEPNGLEIGEENWVAADRAAREIIRKVQPTNVSEERRREVVDYIQRLIRDYLGAEVFPYGSVPLKTYLPDGDIDLTAFGGSNNEDNLANEMKSLLEEEEKNTDAEFVVKDVQLIRAEVKLVKCIVQDIVVDISFNQIGGLCTLCFLEQVDRLIGRDHLFKCSIILIKAWCYYESRILGAHHGLISTYALETLVLYIFHLYSSTLDGPVTVLYKFLDCFSKLDWDTYCVSVRGPVRLSLLPAIDVEIPEDCDQVLLLSNDFLNSCVTMFSVPSRDGTFQTKHLNIVDPLKDVNNLGRSVSRGNYYRIRSAFSYGARTLARILQQPQASIADELEKFFANTMARHGGGQRPDVRDFDKSLISNRHISIAPFPEAGCCKTENFYEYLDQCDDATTPAFEYLRISGSHDENLLVDKNDAEASREFRYPVQDQRPSSCSGDSNHMDADHGRTSRSGLAESLNSSDLTGDYESYIHHLQYGRWYYEYGVAIQPQPLPLSPLSSATYPWDGLLPILHYKQNGFSHHHRNGFHPNPAIYGMRPILLPAVPFAWEDVPKHRGTGTYLPNTNISQHALRSPAMKARNHASSRSPHHNGRNLTVKEPYMLDRSSHEPAQPIDKTVVASSSDSHLVLPPHQNGHPNANGSFILGVGIDLELVGPASGTLQENSRPQRTASSSPRTVVSGVQRPQTAPSKEQERVSLRSSYVLKDEDDFPPLSTGER